MSAQIRVSRFGNKAFERLYQVVVGLPLLVFALLIMLPVLYIIAVSFTSAESYIPGKLTLWPERWSLDAYRLILSGNGFRDAFKASLFLTVVGTPLSLTVTSMFAYGLSKKGLPGRRLLLGMALLTMLFNAGLVPSYLLIKGLGLIDSWWAIILPGALSPWTVLVLKSFFQNLPQELEDAAEIDGCNHLQIFTRIILPLSKAPLAAFTLFFAVGYWNTYFAAVIYLTDAQKWPLQVMLQQVVMLSQAARFVSSEAASRLQTERLIPPETVKMATIVVVLAPILAVYPFLQKYFAKGVLLGSIKG